MNVLWYVDIVVSCLFSPYLYSTSTSILPQFISITCSFSFISIFKDGTIFDSELFDIPHSQLSLLSEAPPSSLKATSTLNPDYDVHWPPLSNTTPSQTTPTTTNSNKNSMPVVYNSESLLLLEGNSQRKEIEEEERKQEELHKFNDILCRSFENFEEEGKKVKKKEMQHLFKETDNKNYASFSNGSYLLHSQRLNLLHTLPLSYTVTSLSNGTIINKRIDNAINTKGVISSKPSPLLYNVQGSYHMGYNFPTRSSGHTHFTTSTLQDLSQVCPHLTDINSTPKEVWLTAESIKPGQCCSTVIDFHQIIALTHLQIPANSNISSVKLEAESIEKGEEFQIISSTELSSRSLIIGNFTAPILLRYLRVTCIFAGKLSSEKCIFSLGKYHGRLPHSCDLDHTHLISLQKNALAQYFHQKEQLIQLLSNTKKDEVESHTYFLQQQLNSLYSQCQDSQIKYNRLKNIAFLQQQQLQKTTLLSTSTFRTCDLKVDLSSLSFDKLTRLSSTLIDTILVLSNHTPHPAHTLNLTEESAKELFLSIMVHSASLPTVQGRLSAVLVMYCGGRVWWGRLLAGLVKELFTGEGEERISKFNRERLV